jgi:photosystem II stability/assembly factor-like uncharacterized protein
MTVFRSFALLLLLPFLFQEAWAQWSPQRIGVAVGLRGVSAVNRRVAWAGGAEGTYLRTTDWGNTWTVGQVPGAAESDFRDVYAVNQSVAYLLSSGKLARIYKTIDAGKNWVMQYENKSPGAFLDGFAFWDAQSGIAFGDPLNGKFLIVRTQDGGQTWHETPSENLPPALPEEAAFAASGTSICVQGTRHVWFCTGGGQQARAFHSGDGGEHWEVNNLPLTCNSASSGAFSIAFRDSLNGVVAGGDFKAPLEASDNCAVTRDGGKTWELKSGLQPTGLKQCVTYVPGTRILLATGDSGTGYSMNEGSSWQIFDELQGQPPYHSISFSSPRNGRLAAWAVGARGSIGKIPDLRLRKLLKGQ